MNQPQMEDGVFYDLIPPIVVEKKMSPHIRKTFSRVLCEYRVPDSPTEYVVKGIPEGETEEESFVLRFSKKGSVKASRSKNQKLQIIKFESGLSKQG